MEERRIGIEEGRGRERRIVIEEGRGREEDGE